MVIDVYLAMQDGVWLYQPIPHILQLHLPGDIRRQTGYQDFVATAPLNLIYVAHGERMTDVSPEDRRLYASVDAGFIGQNVYLFCASEELATVFRGAVNYTCPNIAVARSAVRHFCSNRGICPRLRRRKTSKPLRFSMEEVLTGMASELRPSRRTARRIFENEAYRRIIAGNVPATLSEFSTQLAAWFKDTYPAAPVPPASFIEAAIHDTWHRRHEIIGSEL